MTLRMWKKNGPIVDIKDKKGYFDIAYGDVSQAQKLDVWLPEGEGVFPAIICIHGGGYIACDKRQLDMIAPMMKGLEKGIALISLNYRLVDETCFPEPVKDIKQAIRFIKAHAKQWHIDADKLVVWGGSAGGNLTLMSALFENDAYFDNANDLNLTYSASIKGGVAWYPQTDFKTCEEELKINSIMNSFLRKELTDLNENEYEPAFPLSHENEFPMHNNPEGCVTKYLGCCPNSEEEIIEKASPINHIHKDMPKIYIQHGSDDEILPMQQSIRFAMKANEVCGEKRVKLEIIPGAIHSSILFETDENLEKVYAFIRELFNQ